MPQALLTHDFARRHAGPADRTLDLEPSFAAHRYLENLVDASLVLAEDWHGLTPDVQALLARSGSQEDALGRLAEHGLLTRYQADRIKAGTTYGLVLGNYRVLDRVGAGGMGIVFKAEHVLMRRVVAVKLVPIMPGQDARILLRFLAETRVAATLRHPNVVSALDAGRVCAPEPNLPVLHYLVLEYVDGRDLESLVRAEGPLDVTSACDLIYQAACGLAEAYERGLVHRDVKPSNMLVTADRQLKITDFGLARDFRAQLTEPGSVLGTLEYMAPEQAGDAHKADIRSDIYGLGGSLYFCLTGKVPFPAEDGSVTRAMARRAVAPPLAARRLRPDVPRELDAVIARMTAPEPADRFPTPQAVKLALAPFLREAVGQELPLDPAVTARPSAHGDRPTRLLIVDDEAHVRDFCRLALRNEPYEFAEADNGRDALTMLAENRYDLVLLDANLPGAAGEEVLAAVRKDARAGNLRVVMMSGGFSADEMSRLLLAGADDFLMKPFTPALLHARICVALRLKAALDKSESIARRLGQLNRAAAPAEPAGDAACHATLVLALTGMLEGCTTETRGHLVRLQRYCRVLAEEAGGLTPFADAIDQAFIDDLECCAPLHDIGTVLLPDHVLHKPGRLNGEELAVMHTHTTLGADMIQAAIDKHGPPLEFLRTAVALARSHHEYFDGSGYPDGLAGEAIPLAARIFTIADVYDALRSKRPYRPALSHSTAVQMLTDKAGRFDPGLLAAFRRASDAFDRIRREVPD